MELVTKRDMNDAETVLKMLYSAEDGTPLSDFIHDIAQAIADGRRPVEQSAPEAKP